jgi:hypothetical protein
VLSEWGCVPPYSSNEFQNFIKINNSINCEHTHEPAGRQSLEICLYNEFMLLPCK